jgi:Endonuclease/Exonuclease/phosphatase family
MKLISLNMWGGTVYEPLLDFIKTHAPGTDIFCFQEIYTSPENVVVRGIHVNILETLTSMLPDFDYVFAPIQDNMADSEWTNTPCTFGQAVFVRKFYPILEHGFKFVYRDRNMLEGNDMATLPVGFIHVSIADLTIVGIHGLSRPGDKLDTPSRLVQSKMLNEFLDGVSGPKILCGDFNLSPGTQSIAMLEENMENLIAKFGIKDTRGMINAQKYPGKEIQNYADYTFVSPDVTVHSFEVPDAGISDHLPMILEFS